MGSHYALVNAEFGNDGLESYYEIVSADNPDVCFARWTELLATDHMATWYDVWLIHDEFVETPDMPYPHHIDWVKYPKGFRQVLEAAWEISKLRRTA